MRYNRIKIWRVQNVLAECLVRPVTARVLTHGPARSLADYNWHESAEVKRLFRGEWFLWAIINPLDN